MREVIETARLVLRPMSAKDIPAMVCLLDDLRVSGNTSNIPYPYGEADARDWVGRQPDLRGQGQAYVYSVCDAETDAIVGAMGLHWSDRHTGDGQMGWELGYWFGVPHWGQGFATEAGTAIVREAEASLAPDRIVAGHFTENPKSGHVLVKLGFEYTGVICDSYSLARRAKVPCRSMVRTAGAPLPDPGRAP